MTRTVRTPDWLAVPAKTLSPTPLITGIDSPVSMLSSTLDEPSVTVPSTGKAMPGLTSSSSSTTTSARGLSGDPSAGQMVSGSSPPSPLDRLAVWCTHHACSHSEATKKKTMALASQRSSSASAPMTAMSMVHCILRIRW